MKNNELTAVKAEMPSLDGLPQPVIEYVMGLVAENVALKSVVGECQAYFIAGIRNTIRPSNEGYLHMLCDTIEDETPAADAAIAEVKRPLIEEIESLKKNSIASFSDVMDYNPETGIVTAKVRFSNRPAGMPIGSNTSYGYLATSLFGKKVQIHRLAWFLHYGEWPEMDIDHVNGIKKDNRISNLRLATISQNQLNKPIQKNNSSGVKGVYWNKRDNKYIASVQHQGRKHTAGRFDDLESAKNAVEELRIKLAGEFCNHGEFAANLRAGRKG